MLPVYVLMSVQSPSQVKCKIDSIDVIIFLYLTVEVSSLFHMYRKRMLYLYQQKMIDLIFEHELCPYYEKEV